MAQKRAEERWEHPTYKYAYVREQDGMARTVIHGGRAKCTGLKWKLASRRKAMDILEQRLEAYLAQKAGRPMTTATVHGGNPKVMTCADLWNSYVKHRFPGLSKPLRAEYTRLFQLIPGNIPCTSSDAILDAIETGVQAAGYTRSMPEKVYTRIRTVFNFGVDRAYIAFNPVFKDSMPDKYVGTPTPYTQEQIDNIEFMTPGRHQAYVLFLVGTGCRPVEALRLLPEEVAEDCCYLYSYKNGQRTKKYRVVPFDLCPLAKRAVDMARAGAYSDINGRVFGMNNYAKASAAFNAAVYPDGRGLYDIRKYAINEMRRRGIPEEVRHAIAGHEKEVAERHYETQYTAKELTSICVASGFSVAENSYVNAA